MSIGKRADVSRAVWCFGEKYGREVDAEGGGVILKWGEGGPLRKRQRGSSPETLWGGVFMRRPLGGRGAGFQRHQRGGRTGSGSGEPEP